MKYKVMRPDGKTKQYRDINRAIQDSPNGSKIVNVKTGQTYKVTK